MDLMGTNIGRLCASSDSSFNMFWHQRIDNILNGKANTTHEFLYLSSTKCTPFCIFCKHFDSKVCCLQKDAKKRQWRPRLRLLDWSP